jgi:steroid 5-alpha reductase family enzyme
MPFLDLYLNGLCVMLALALMGWIVSVFRQNVTHVDSMWSLFFLLASFAYVESFSAISARGLIVLNLLTIWALRLSIYLTRRNWGPHEDHRYVAIRQNNTPHFKWTSLYIVFGLQAVLAWIISLPILGSINSSTPLNIIDIVGILLTVFGITWESIADWQLTKFKRMNTNQHKVLNSGVWRYSRHPNYFGECCVWWGFFLIALAGGAWWSLPSVILMTLLLLKVSGVALLEKDIAERRPEYLHYIKTTNSFIPGKPKS